MGSALLTSKCSFGNKSRMYQWGCFQSYESLKTSFHKGA